MAAYQTSLIAYTATTATLLTISLAFTITSLATNAWLVTSQRSKQQNSYGLLGVTQDGDYVSYSDFDSDNTYGRSYYWFGLIIFILFVVSGFQNLLVILYLLATWPFRYISAFTWKSISMTLITLSAIFQLLGITLWAYVTSYERTANKHLSYGYSFWLALSSAIISAIAIYMVNKTFNVYIEYENLPTLDDDYEHTAPAPAADPRDILYPPRQKVQQTGKQIKNAGRGNVTYQS